VPYKDPERKRQWEREHREERNARRRKQPALGLVVTNPPTSSYDPTPDQELQGWQLVIGLVLGIAVVCTVVLVIRRTLQGRKRGTQKKLGKSSPAAIS